MSEAGSVKASSAPAPARRAVRRPRRYLRTSYPSDTQVFPTLIQRLGMGALAAFLCILPWVADNYILYIANLVGLAIIGAHGLNLLTGYTGQVSLAHAGLMAIGAYGAGVLAAKGAPFLLAVAGGAVLAALAGLVVALPALRLKGLYLAMATLAFQFLVGFVIANWTEVTGGSTGMSIPRARLFGFTLTSDRHFYWLIMGTAVLATAVMVNLHRSRFGRGLVAVRDHDIAAGTMGLSVTGHKLLAFALSAVFAALSGALLAFYTRYVAPDNFTLLYSIEYLAMIIVGGLGTVLGGILGALFMTLLPEALRFFTHWVAEYWPAVSGRFGDVRTVAYGLVIVLSLMFAPEGLAGLWRDIKTYFRQWPFSY